MTAVASTPYLQSNFNALVRHHSTQQIQVRCRHSWESHALLTRVSPFAGLKDSSYHQTTLARALTLCASYPYGPCSLSTYCAVSLLPVPELALTLQRLFLSSHSSTCKLKLPSINAPFLLMNTPLAVIYHQGLYPQIQAIARAL